MHMDLCRGEGSVGRFDTAIDGTSLSNTVKSPFDTWPAGHIDHNATPR